MTKRKPRRRLRKIVFLVLTLAIPVVFLEIALQAHYRIVNGRFLHQRMALPIYEPDEDRHYRLKSNLAFAHRTNEYDVTYYTNGQGLRTDHRRQEIPVTKPEDAVRVLFLGPSFAFGWGNEYEDAYATVIGRGLRLAGRRVEVMNLGTPAQPVAYQLCWLEKQGALFAPDVIVQTVYGSAASLVSECREPERPPTIRRGYLIPGESTLKSRFIATAKNFGLVFYGWYIYQSLVPDPSIGSGQELYEDLDEQTALDLEGKVDQYLSYIDFVRRAMGKEVPVVFLHVPLSYVVRPADLARFGHQVTLPPDELRRETKEMARLLGERGIPFVEPTDALVERDRDERMYHFLDIHFTPAGNHVVAAEAIPVVQRVLDSLGDGGG